MVDATKETLHKNRTKSALELQLDSRPGVMDLISKGVMHHDWRTRIPSDPSALESAASSDASAAAPAPAPPPPPPPSSRHFPQPRNPQHHNQRSMHSFPSAPSHHRQLPPGMASVHRFDQQQAPQGLPASSFPRAAPPGSAVLQKCVCLRLPTPYWGLCRVTHISHRSSPPPSRPVPRPPSVPPAPEPLPTLSEVAIADYRLYALSRQQLESKKLDQSFNTAQPPPKLQSPQHRQIIDQVMEHAAKIQEGDTSRLLDDMKETALYRAEVCVVLLLCCCFDPTQTQNFTLSPLHPQVTAQLTAIQGKATLPHRDVQARIGAQTYSQQRRSLNQELLSKVSSSSDNQLPPVQKYVAQTAMATGFSNAGPVPHRRATAPVRQWDCLSTPPCTNNTPLTLPPIPSPPLSPPHPPQAAVLKSVRKRSTGKTGKVKTFRYHEYCPPTGAAGKPGVARTSSLKSRRKPAQNAPRSASSTYSHCLDQQSYFLKLKDVQDHVTEASFIAVSSYNSASSTPFAAADARAHTAPPMASMGAAAMDMHDSAMAAAAAAAAAATASVQQQGAGNRLQRQLSVPTGSMMMMMDAGSDHAASWQLAATSPSAAAAASEAAAEAARRVSSLQNMSSILSAQSPDHSSVFSPDDMSSQHRFSSPVFSAAAFAGPDAPFAMDSGEQPPEPAHRHAVHLTHSHHARAQSWGGPSSVCPLVLLIPTKPHFVS